MPKPPSNFHSSPTGGTFTSKQQVAPLQYQQIQQQVTKREVGQRVRHEFKMGVDNPTAAIVRVLHSPPAAMPFFHQGEIHHPDFGIHRGIYSSQPKAPSGEAAAGRPFDRRLCLRIQPGTDPHPELQLHGGFVWLRVMFMFARHRGAALLVACCFDGGGSQRHPGAGGSLLPARLLALTAPAKRCLRWCRWRRLELPLLASSSTLGSATVSSSTAELPSQDASVISPAPAESALGFRFDRVVLRVPRAKLACAGALLATRRVFPATALTTHLLLMTSVMPL